MTVQESLVQQLREMASKIEAGAYGTDDDVNVMVINDDMEELMLLYADDIE